MKFRKDKSNLVIRNARLKFKILIATLELVLGTGFQSSVLTLLG